MWGWEDLDGRQRWGGDRVPPSKEPGDQDAGDHQGPPHHPSSTLAPTDEPTPFREVDAYYRRLIGPRWIFRYPNDFVKTHYRPSMAVLKYPDGKVINHYHAKRSTSENEPGTTK